MSLLNFDGITNIKRSVSLPSGSIRNRMLVDIALKNLFYKRLRTSLTIMGVMIGVGAVLFLLAFGFGLRNVVSNQVVDSNSIRTIDVLSAKSQLVKLSGDTVSKINDMQNVEKVAKIYNEAGTTKYENSDLEAVLYGADQEYLSLSNYKRIAGNATNLTSAEDVFVNHAYAQAIGINDPKELIGKDISIGYRLKGLTDTPELQDKAQKITGKVRAVLETGSGAEVYVSSKVLEDVGAANASQVKVLVQNKAGVPEVRKKIEALGLVTSSPLETLDQINQVFAFLNILFLGFGSIGLIIAILGMFNTLTISLLERTKEIGLMVTLGARKRDIRRLFMIEAVSLSLFGGLAGSASAFGCSLLVDVVLNKLAQGRGVSEHFSVFSFSAPLLSITLLFSMTLGLLVVYLPAKRAANINPIEALKN